MEVCVCVGGICFLFPAKREELGRGEGRRGKEGLVKTHTEQSRGLFRSSFSRRNSSHQEPNHARAFLKMVWFLDTREASLAWNLVNPGSLGVCGLVGFLGMWLQFDPVAVGHCACVCVCGVCPACISSVGKQRTSPVCVCVCVLHVR